MAMRRLLGVVALAILLAGRVASAETPEAAAESWLKLVDGGKYVVIQFDTVFEHKASASETVTPMLDPDGVWRVSGYFFR